MNIMVIPMPYTIRATDFKPFKFADGTNFPGQDADVGEARYFDFQPSDRLDIEKVLGLLENAQNQEVSRVHLIVFPELALNESDFKALKIALTEHFKDDNTKIPMIVAGVGGRHENETNSGLGYNKVILSFFFANKWYDLEQDKHHRWKLDQSQIRQYSIAAILNSRYKWWEGIHVPHRRLNFVCPNNWLTICPLICEDLAQLEPVSGLIRGVGPTMVIAILLDGPQITERWSARYVGVLADDPGSSILTVTSLGMARRSRDRGKAENRNVILWKDQVNGWEPIELKEGRDAIVLSVVAEFREEYTADRRSDHKAAPVLVLQGWKTVRFVNRDTKTPSAKQTAQRASEYDRVFPANEKWDVEEVAIAEYLIDAILDLNPERFVEQFNKLVMGQTISMAGHEASGTKINYKRGKLERILTLWEIIKETSDFKKRRTTVKSINEGADFPLSSKITHDVLREFFRFLSEQSLYFSTDDPTPSEKNQLWEEIICNVEAKLESLVPYIRRNKGKLAAEWTSERELLRIRNLVYLSILWATYNRIAGEIGSVPSDPSRILDSKMLCSYRDKLRKIDGLMKIHIMEDALQLKPRKKQSQI